MNYLLLIILFLLSIQLAKTVEVYIFYRDSCSNKKKYLLQKEERNQLLENLKNIIHEMDDNNEIQKTQEKEEILDLNLFKNV